MPSAYSFGSLSGNFNKHQPTMNKLFVLIALLTTSTSCLTAQSSIAAELAPSGLVEPIKDVFPRWSVIGEWRVTHPDWTDVVKLGADGTLATVRQGTTGRWILTADGGTPMIIFRWDLFGTESLTMVTPDHFRGQKRNGRFIDMQRSDDSPKPALESK